MLDFASYLRDASEAAEQDPAVLAAKFGLPRDIVEESLQAIGRAIRKPEVKRPSKIIGFKDRVRSFMHDRPIWTAVILGVFMVGALLLGRVAGSSVPPIAGVVIVVVAIVVSNFVRAQMRYAVASAFIVVAPAAIYITYRTIQSGGEAGAISGEPVSVLFSLFIIMSVFMSWLTMPAALIGGYRRMRREADNEARLDRFVMLQRIFDLKSRLAERASTVAPVSRQQWFVKWRKKWLLVAIGFALTFGLGEVLIRTTIGMPTPGSPGDPPSSQVLVAMLLAIAVCAAALVSGLVSGSWQKGVVAGSLFLVVSYLTIIAVMPNGWAVMSEPFQERPYALVALLLNPMLGLIGGLGGSIESNAERKRRIAATDRAAVLSEIVRLQQALKSGAQDVCLMVVDAVGSTKMKLGADQYDIEASFGAFQNYIARKVAGFGGSVYSTAGDGAITRFDDAQSAFDCAFSVLADLKIFNDNHNRLGAPFELRVGIHSGHVPGELDKIAFSRVIDVAAHMEKVAPVGGIASSGKAFLAIKGADLKKMDEQLDGEDVYVLEPKHEL